MALDGSERIVKPADCAIAFGFPLSQAAFHRNITGRGAKEFAGKFRSWNKYYTQVVKPLENARPEMTRLGAKIYCDVTLDAFADLFRLDRFCAIILFAHWRGEGIEAGLNVYDEFNSAVEFSDGFWGIKSIVDRVPEQFAGVLDLCVCHPGALVQALHRERQNCPVKYTNRPAIPLFWIYFYLSLFKHLAATDTTYLQALVDVTKLKRST